MDQQDRFQSGPDRGSAGRSGIRSGPSRRWLSSLIRSVLPAAAVLYCPKVAAEPLSATAVDDLRSRIVPVENRVLILTPGGLCRFQPDTEAWTTTTGLDGLPGGVLRGLSVTDENLWIASDGGIGLSDIRFDDWQRYIPGESYPGKVLFDVEADDDYAYGGTDAGVARFDRYILEWERVGDPEGDRLGAVYDVAVGEKRVWFALDRGVAEYRKETESLRIERTLGLIESPRVLALRQSSDHLWALTDAGIARYDKELQSWTSFAVGVDLPDARIHQVELEGEDLWLGTDAGLWRYRAESGIWRRDESGDEMPGERVQAFALESDRIWVVTESAFAVYEAEAGRWVDFTSSVPLAPADVLETSWTDKTLLFLGREEIVYGLAQGQSNPSLFTYRSHPIPAVSAEEGGGEAAYRIGIDDAGLGIVSSSGSSLHVKGGATIYVENEGRQEEGLGDLAADTRLDLTLSGRFARDRTINGLYDSTDPDNPTYQLTYRGARSDLVRAVSLGEIEQQLFNSRLAPGTGLTGGTARAEFGSRSESTRRRLLTVDGWLGERRTVPGRDVFFGGNRTVEGQAQDVDYLKGQVFPIPAGWSGEEFRKATVYLDDGNRSTDDANTEHRDLAGRSGSWDRLAPNRGYVLGPGGTTLILSAPLSTRHAVVAVRGEGIVPPSEGEADLTDRWLRNHYWITIDPVPGSMSVAVVDSTGSASDAGGVRYLERFGLDSNGDGLLDPERFSPISGLLSFPDTLPFPADVYAEEPASLFFIRYLYRTRLHTFQLSHRNLVPRSEQITVDRELLRADVDYSVIPSSGLFIFFEHVLLDDDSVIEVFYLYEIDERSGEGEGEKGPVAAGQIGFAPSDHLLVGLNTTRWRDASRADVTTADLNARLEWKDEDHFLRLSPEMAVSTKGSDDTVGEETAPPGGCETDRTGSAVGIGVQGRYRNLEVSGSRRSLGADYLSFENRRTLLGRLREESEAWARLDLNRHLQTELEWNRDLSDSVLAGDWEKTASGEGEGEGSCRGGTGEESSFMATARLLRSGLPNLEFRRGRVLIDSPSSRQEKWISRAELELSPDQAGIEPLGIRRLWLRAFFQRSERNLSYRAPAGGRLVGAADGERSNDRRTTDHGFVRVNGSFGSPLSWNMAFEDRRTRLPGSGESRKLSHYQVVDATVQTQPHASVDAFLRWEADRDLFWCPEGKGGGFAVNRLLLATTHLYPGRVVAELSSLSLRIDVARIDRDDGEPGRELPGPRSLWSRAPEVSRWRRAENRIFETRLQVVSWMRLVERFETESDRSSREGLAGERGSEKLENRLEIRPRGGLLTLRMIGSRSDGRDVSATKERRFSGQWDQTWGKGFLTYLSLDGQRGETHERDVGDLTYLWNPQVRLTWRRSRWQTDANLGGALAWTRTKDTSVGVLSTWEESRKQTVTASLSVQPLKVLTLKMQYVLNRSEVDAGSGASGGGWRTEHDLRIRLLVRS